MILNCLIILILLGIFLVGFKLGVEFIVSGMNNAVKKGILSVYKTKEKK